MYTKDFINCHTKCGITCFTPNGQQRNKNDIWNNDLNLIWNKLDKSMRNEIIECWHEQNKYEQIVINNILDEIRMLEKEEWRN